MPGVVSDGAGAVIAGAILACVRANAASIKQGVRMAMSSGSFPCDTPIERIHYGQWIGRLWRISPMSDWRKAAHRPRAARWHTQGPDVLYTSTCETLAALEALAHLDENRKPHRLLSLDFPGGATLRVVDPDALPRDWKRDMAATRAIGDAWLRSGASDLLWVPSVHARRTGNVLVNPAELQDASSGKPPVAIDHGLFRFSPRLRRR
jgi:RES domain-containing protein